MKSLNEADAKCKQSQLLRDRVVVLEAELERLAEYVTETTQALTAQQQEKRHQDATLQQTRDAHHNLQEEGVACKGALTTLLHRLHSLTVSMLPSFTAAETKDDASTLDITECLSDGVAFLSEVFKARTEASFMIREKMKTEQLELQARISVGQHKETVLQEGLRMSEDNIVKEREMFQAQLAEAGERAHTEAERAQAGVAEYQKHLEAAETEIQKAASAKAALERDMSERESELSALEEQLKKEAAARRHLQRLLGEEQNHRALCERQVKEMRLQMKLCGLGATPTLKEEDLVNMVTRLNTEQGALEVENCNLRDKLHGVPHTDDSDTDYGEDSLNEQVQVAMDNSGADIALAETLLERKMKKLAALQH